LPEESDASDAQGDTSNRHDQRGHHGLSPGPF
jgi:hypothetical protein